MSPEPVTYPQSWYPVVSSRDLRRGRHIAVRLFDSDWLVYRGENGQVATVSRYCCHLGTDLCNGKVVGNTIQCPMHGWRFGLSGRCEFIAPDTSPAPSHRLDTLPTEEHFGVIFVFWGTKPLYEFPVMEELAGSRHYSRALSVPLAAPSTICAINTFDTQHYETIHARRFVNPPSVTSPSPYALRLNYTARILRVRWVDHLMHRLVGETTRVSIEVWGASLLYLRNHDTRIGSLIAPVPVSANQCRLFMVAIAHPAADDSGNLPSTMKLAVAVRMFRAYLRSDVRIIRNIRLHQGTLLDDRDAVLKRYFSHLQQLPQLATESLVGPAIGSVCNPRDQRRKAGATPV